MFSTMNIRRVSGFILLGIAISTLAQYACLQFANLFPLEIQRIDPAFDLLYSTMGILVSAATGLYFGLKKNWSLVAGLALGILLWWPFVGILMTIQGVWF